VILASCAARGGSVPGAGEELEIVQVYTAIDLFLATCAAAK
jgi:hypothetical protein